MVSRRELRLRWVSRCRLRPLRKSRRARPVGPAVVYDVEPARRQHRGRAVFRAQADQQEQRASARAAVVSSRAGPHRPLRLQPARRRQRDVRGRQGQRGVRARRGDRQGNLDLRDRRHADQSRIQLLGEQGSIGSPHHLRVAQLPAAARRANGKADCELRRQRPRESARGAGAHAACRPAARSRDRRGTCSRIFSSSDRRRAKGTTRRPATSARSTC